MPKYKYKDKRGRHLSNQTSKVSTTTTMGEQSQPEKWQGKASAKLLKAKADEAWSLVSSFSSIHLWFRDITCQILAGTDGHLGCVRHCAAQSAAGGDQQVMWANEELTAFDPAGRSYSYKVTDNNIGFVEYVATLKVSPEVEEEEEASSSAGGDHGCRIELTFESEPSAGWTEEGLVAYLQMNADSMAMRVEEALKRSAKPLLPAISISAATK